MRNSTRIVVNQNPCLMKNETLSINKYVVLFDFLWMIMFIITLQGFLIICLEWASSLKMKLEITTLEFSTWVLGDFKVSITNSAPNGVVSLQMVKGNVLNEETRRKAHDSSS
ncbi:hypothetical protein CR513_49269, partial [Mucuna pruriens]